ncbi:FadR/GntR family transcriptional regulator [Arthrobacter sp. H14]|uniref:FadR/GntR family transcriptional regulator n=1 Tax=Arthrobacter sp. H14 TaxID=1312959 RepID=UPI00047CA9D7|nr:FCD domain-containing protein [Arthrobacter sp. H14]
MISPATPPRFSAQTRLRALQTDIMELILARELDVGDSLPTESELCLALGVGRNTLRESLKVLQAVGVIEIRHGFGMFVAPSNFAALTDGLTFRGRLSLRHQGVEALELINARQTVESALIDAAMDSMDTADLEALEAAVDRMEQLALQCEDTAEAEEEFHRRLFQPLGNEFLTHLVGVFRHIDLKIQQDDGGSSGDPAAAAALHREIFQAVADGDKAAAVGRLGQHFDGLREKINGILAVADET